MKIVLLTFATGFAWISALAGNNCYWTGGGDGVNWSDDANWDVAPQSGVGDILWFTNACSVCNDSADFCPKTLKFRGTGPITVSGQRIAFTSGGTGLDSECYVIMNAPIKVSNNNNSFMHLVRFDYNGLVTVVGAKTLTLTTQTATPPAPDNKGNAPDVRINGGVSAPDGTLTFCLGRNTNADSCRHFWVNSVLDVKTLNWCGGYRDQAGYLTVGGQKWGEAYMVFGRCRPTLANAYSPTTVLSWSSTARNANGEWDLNGFDQTIDRIWSIVNPNTQDIITSLGPATLTMNATDDGRCWGIVKGAVSLVWAPQGPFTMDFSNVVHTTTGDLTALNGTMSVSGAATFATVNAIRVGDGATFDLKSTAANSLAGAKNLLVEGTGVFRVAATATTPFSSAPVVRVRLDAGAKLAVPAGVTLKVAALSVGGVAKANDTYTGETWIDGAGSVEVSSSALAAASWKTPADGDWATAANWQGGAVPSATTAVKIDAAGPDYEVTAADGTAHNAAISIGGGAVKGTATLKPAGAFTQTAGTLAVNAGGRLALGAGASYDFVSNTSWRDPTAVFDVEGGEVAIDGGTLTADPFYGRMVVNGKVSVKNGTFTVNPWQSASGTATMQTMRVLSGGRIEVGDGGVFWPKPYGWGAYPLVIEGGQINVSGTGMWKTSTATYRYQGWGSVTFSGDAQFGNGSSATVGFEATKAYNDLVVTFKDRARVNIPGATFRMQDGQYNTTLLSSMIVTLDSDATHELGTFAYVGSLMGRGVLNINRGNVKIGDYKFGIGDMGYTISHATMLPTGVVNQVGGTLTVSGFNNSASVNYCLGLIIGNTLYTAGTTLPKGADGTYNLSGGIVSNLYGQVVIGGGRGTGRFVQTGGTVCSRYDTRGGSKFEANRMVLGLLNGTGAWEMTGGTATFGHSVFVGGCDTNRYQFAIHLGGQTEDSLAKGRISVRNATFTTERMLVLGERGTGTLEIGPGGTVSAGSFAVSNAASTVSIKLGADGSGNLAIAGDLAVEAGAKLTIDASAVNPENLVRGINVMTWGTASRPYPDVDVTFVGDAQGVLQLKKTAHGYRIPSTRGLLLMVR